jgi:hypothetical protein
MPRLRVPGSGVVVNVSDGTATRLGWPSADEPEPSQTSDAPPKAGRGSGRDAWADYAASQGVEVDDGWSRDDIIQAVEEG